MTAQQLLDMLRDARELQDKAFEQSVLEQLGVDVAYVEQGSVASASTYRPRFEFAGHGYDEDDDPETDEDRRARVGQTARNIERRDWLAWRSSKSWWRWHANERGLASSDTTTLQSIYKAHYSDAAVSVMATRSHPLFAMLKKSGSLT